MLYNFIFSKKKKSLSKKIILIESITEIEEIGHILCNNTIIIAGNTAWKEFSDLYASLFCIRDAVYINLNSINLDNPERDFTESQCIIFNPKSVQITELDSIISKNNKILSNRTRIIGMGGGLICDVAKYLGARLKKEVILIPSILSTTSWLNATSSLKQNEKVCHKRGRIDKVFIDYNLLQKAPIHYNLGGLADILVGYSSIGDWIIAKNDKKRFLMRLPKAALSHTMHLINSIRQQIEDNLENKSNYIPHLVNGFINAMANCYGLLSGRPLEGSEHLLYYAMEEKINKPMNHGRIIALNTLVCLYLQENCEIPLKEKSASLPLISTKELADLYKKFGIIQSNLFDDDFINIYIEICLKMPQFVKKNKMMISIWNYVENSDYLTTEILKRFLDRIINT